MALQRAGAAQANFPWSHQADPQELPQSGWSIILDQSSPLNPNGFESKCVKIPTCGSLCVLQVIILDPTQENAAELLSVAEMFYANNIPLRLVFVSWLEVIKRLVKDI